MGKAKEPKLAMIVIRYDANKMKGLNQYLERKNMNIAVELEAYLQQLYLKHVPQSVRDFISYQSEYEDENQSE